MRIETRFLVVFLPAVALVMTVYALLAVREREEVLLAEARQGTEAYAVAVQLVLSSALTSAEPRAVREVVAQLSTPPLRYTVIVYAVDGRTRMAVNPAGPGLPEPAEEIAGLLTDGRARSLDRMVGSEFVHSVLHPVQGTGGAMLAVLEVAQSLGFIAAEKALLRRHFFVSTVALWVVVGITTLWLVRGTVGRPLRRMVTAVQAVGRGDLAYRMSERESTSELRALAAEFNRMAGSLQVAQTSLVRQSEDSLALERKLRQSEKMLAVSGLSAGLAHQIAAPLNVIIGRAQLLESTALGEADRRNVQIITEQVGRISLLVHRLLDFSRRRQAHFEPIDLRIVIRDALAAVEGELAEAGVEVSLEFAGAGEVSGDAELLQEVCTNVILNAVQAMAQAAVQKRLVVRLGSDVATESDAGAWIVRLEFADTGSGIPDDHLNRVFEPFFSTRQRGAGLGLVIARGIVEEHGGSIQARNDAKTGGACICISFPGRSDGRA